MMKNYYGEKSLTQTAKTVLEKDVEIIPIY